MLYLCWVLRMKFSRRNIRLNLIASDHEIYSLRMDLYLPCQSAVPLLGMCPSAVPLTLFGFRTLLCSQQLSKDPISKNFRLCGVVSFDVYYIRH